MTICYAMAGYAQLDIVINLDRRVSHQPCNWDLNLPDGNYRAMRRGERKHIIPLKWSK